MPSPANMHKIGMILMMNIEINTVNGYNKKCKKRRNFEDNLIDSNLILKIENLLNKARAFVATTVNTTLLTTYIGIEKILSNDLDAHKSDSSYENRSIRFISKDLTNKFGHGFSKSNIYNMISFYQSYRSVQSLTGKLTWTHYCELLSINDKEKRSFYEKECINANKQGRTD